MEGVVGKLYWEIKKHEIILIHFKYINPSCWWLVRKREKGAGH